MKTFKLMYIVKNDMMLDQFGRIVERISRYMQGAEIIHIESAPLMTMRLVRVHFSTSADKTKPLKNVFRFDISHEANILHTNLLEPEYNDSFEKLEWKPFVPTWFPPKEGV